MGKCGCDTVVAAAQIFCDALVVNLLVADSLVLPCSALLCAW